MARASSNPGDSQFSFDEVFEINPDTAIQSAIRDGEISEAILRKLINEYSWSHAKELDKLMANIRRGFIKKT